MYILMQWFLTEIPKSPPGIYTLKYLGLDTFAAVHVRDLELATKSPQVLTSSRVIMRTS
jgi:hypothetical protein